LLSYQDISAENCSRKTGAKGFAGFVSWHKTANARRGVTRRLNLETLKNQQKTPCTKIAKTVQKRFGGQNGRTTEN